MRVINKIPSWCPPRHYLWALAGLFLNGSSLLIDAGSSYDRAPSLRLFLLQVYYNFGFVTWATRSNLKSRACFFITLTVFGLYLLKLFKFIFSIYKSFTFLSIKPLKSATDKD